MSIHVSIQDLILEMLLCGSTQPIYLSAKDALSLPSSLDRYWQTLTNVIVEPEALRQGIVFEILGLQIRASENIPQGFAFLPGYIVRELQLKGTGYSPDPRYLRSLKPRTIWERL